MDLITYDIQDAQLLRALQTLQAQLGDLSEPLADVGQALESATELRFASQSDPNGAAWVKLSDKTIALRAKHGTTGKKLHEHGTMQNSLSWQASPTSVTVGFGQPYAAYHEWGTKRMPRRGLLMGDPNAGTLADDDVADVLDIIADHLNRAI